MASHKQQLVFLLIVLIAFSIFTIFRQPLVSALILFAYLLFTLRGHFLPAHLAQRLGGGVGALRPASVTKKTPLTPAPTNAPAKDPVAERHKKRALELLDQRMAAMNGKSSPFIV